MAPHCLPKPNFVTLFTNYLMLREKNFRGGNCSLDRR